jgi:hypothetical protein
MAGMTIVAQAREGRIFPCQGVALRVWVGIDVAREIIGPQPSTIMVRYCSMGESPTLRRQ